MFAYSHVNWDVTVNDKSGEFMDKKQASGMAGVYYVAAELSKRGLIALVTSRNTKTTDLVAVNDDTGKAANFQIKTNGIDTSDSYWLVSEKDKRELPENFIHAFVKLFKEKSPLIYIIPAQIVRENVKTQKAKTGSVWYYVEKGDIEEFKEKWDSVSAVAK